MTVFEPGGLATGIGSMPSTEPYAALAIIRKYMPAIPHWPQLPRRGPQEGFVSQFLQPLVDVRILNTQEGRVWFDTSHPSWPDRLTEFYTVCLAAAEGDREALEHFAFPRDAAPGFYAFVRDLGETGPTGIQFLKGHLVGPLTAGLQLKDDRGRPAYYDEQLRDIIVRTLALHARWQADALTALGRPAILFVDDPLINACGSCAHITLNRSTIVEDLNVILESIHSARALAGVHSCNATDWSLLFESDVDIVSLDAYRFGCSLECYPSQMEAFLERGGVMAWGIVPTMEEAFAEKGHSLLNRLEELWSELARHGLDRQVLLKRSLITPACGTGLLSKELSERIYDLTHQVSSSVMAMARGVTGK